MNEALTAEYGAEIMTPEIMSSIATSVMVMNIIYTVIFILMGWGLYMINNKLGEKYSWLSWIPLLNFWSYSTASKKPLLKYMIFPMITYIASYIIFIVIIFTNISIIYLGYGLIIISFFYMMIMWIKLLHAISLRTGRGVWTTVGLIFVPFIMFPVVGYKLKNNPELKTVTNNNIEL